MWDAERSGFYLAVGRGGRVVDARNRTYAHAFAISGLTEYVQASGDREAVAWTERTFDLLRERAATLRSGFGRTSWHG